jgi:hypothetical protein
MPQFYPNAATKFIAGLLQTELALAKVRLYQFGEITPSIATTRAQLVAAEADYTGYTAGGIELTAFFNALANPIGGHSIDSPKVQFAPASPFTVGNTVGGFWVETAAGDLITVGTFPNAVSMSAEGNGFPLSVSLIFPN